MKEFDNIYKQMLVKANSLPISEVKKEAKRVFLDTSVDSIVFTVLAESLRERLEHDDFMKFASELDSLIDKK